MSLTLAHEAYVSDRFDLLQARFKHEVPADDVRLLAILRHLGPLPGLWILDLGCGKGRFSTHLRAAGAMVVGLDLSTAMLSAAVAEGLSSVRGTARRLPFRDASFDAVIAIEVFEHLGGVGPVLEEARRVLVPGGRLAVIDKNAGSLNAKRPWCPSVLLKRWDQRRGRWMYPANGPVSERWFWPETLRIAIARRFGSAKIEFLLRAEEAQRLVFRAIPATRLLTLWTARKPGGRVG